MKKLGHKFIGIDLDQKYVEITKQKVAQVYPTQINGCYVSIFLGKIVTVRDADWEKIKEEFVIPVDPLQLEKHEILMRHGNTKRKPKYKEMATAQNALFVREKKY